MHNIKIQGTYCLFLNYQQVLNFFRYATEEMDISSSSTGTSTSITDTETDAIHFCDAEMKASLPEIVIEDLRDSDEKIMFYTGLPNYHTFNALYESLIESGANRISTEVIGNMNNVRRKK